MSLLTIISNASLELGLEAPSNVVNSSDLQVKQLLAQCNREGKELRNKFDWPQLSKEHSFTLSASTASYALPDDFERFIFCTHWDRSNHWEILGPLSAQEWQLRKSGIVTNAPRRRFRIKGYAANQFYLDPTPVAADAGETMVFEYQSKNWCRPQIWAAGLSISTNDYIFYDGNYYRATTSGTTGATPPTHTSSTASDGGVTWSYSDDAYESMAADTDVSHLDENLITLGIKWRFTQAKGLPWEVYRSEYEAAFRRMSSDLRSAGSLSLVREYSSQLLGFNNIPDSGYG